MSKFLSGVAVGVILGIIITILFIYIGGGGWLEYMGDELMAIGKNIESSNKTTSSPLPPPEVSPNKEPTPSPKEKETQGKETTKKGTK